MALDDNLRIALVESNIKWGDKTANILQLEEDLTKIPQGTDIVVLPELFTTGFITSGLDCINTLAEKNTDYTISRLEQLAKKYGTAIAGSFLAHTLKHIYNRAFFVEPPGETTFYDKHHLFTMGNENKFYTSGKLLPPIIRFRGWNIKLVVCYDLRFPVWCRNVSNNYDLLIVVANWPKSREYVWRQLLIARAIENQCYVCGVNRTGIDENGVEFPENSSIIIDYKGNPIQADSQGSYNYNIGLKALRQFREKFPVWQDADSFKIGE